MQDVQNVQEVTQALREIVGAEHVLQDAAISDDYARDEALTVVPRRPDWVVRPSDTDQVARVLALADARRIPVTARGNGTGLSGACVARKGGILEGFAAVGRAMAGVGGDLIRVLAMLGEHRQYWDTFYASRVSADVPVDPSSFASWVAPQLELKDGQAFRYSAMMEMIETGKLQPQLLVGKKISLDEAPAALMQMDQFAGVGIGVITRF